MENETNVDFEAIRSIVRQELIKLNSDPSLITKDIHIWDKLPSKNEMKKLGTTLEKLYKLQNMIIWALKKGKNIICLVVFLIGLYNSLKFGTDIFLPGNLPDLKQLAQIIRTESLNYFLPENDSFQNKNEKYIVFSPSLLNIHSNNEFQLIKDKYINNKDEIFKEDQTTMVAFSAIHDDHILENASSSSSSSSSSESSESGLL